MRPTLNTSAQLAKHCVRTSKLRKRIVRDEKSEPADPAGGTLLRQDLVDSSSSQDLNVLYASLDVDDLDILQLLALGLVRLLERSELALDHGVLHVVAFSGADAGDEGLQVGAEIDKVYIGIWVFVVESGCADDVAVLLLERTASDDNTLGPVLELHNSLVS